MIQITRTSRPLLVPRNDMSDYLRVLHVEDQESDASLVKRTLEKAGLHVHSERVEDAPAMRAALAEQSWDVIIYPGFLKPPQPPDKASQPSRIVGALNIIKKLPIAVGILWPGSTISMRSMLPPASE